MKSSGERRTLGRELHRVSCDLLVLGERHAAITSDLSATGIYVRTTQAPPIGTTVHVHLHEAGGRTIEVDAKVVREYRPHRRDSTAQPRGLGLKIVAAPEEYFQLIMELSEVPHAS